MAIGWLAVLKTVPWSEVISNAPMVADGAKKLWNAVAKKPALQEVPTTDAQSSLSSEARAIAAMESRIAATEAAASDLHGQMLASSELIKALADQNAQLIKRIEASRLRVLWLTAATVVVAIAAAASLALVLMRHAA
jgi:hypothetical protein